MLNLTQSDDSMLPGSVSVCPCLIKVSLLLHGASLYNANVWLLRFQVQIQYVQPFSGPFCAAIVYLFIHSLPNLTGEKFLPSPIVRPGPKENQISKGEAPQTLAWPRLWKHSCQTFQHTIMPRKEESRFGGFVGKVREKCGKQSEGN